MLGRRAAVVAGTVVLAVTGGGAALAANQPGSHSSKPAHVMPSHTFSYSAGTVPRHMGKGNCPNMGGSSSSNTSNDL
jgi:hypothetical protein